MNQQHNSLDARNPWVINIHELTRRPGEMKELDLALPAEPGIGVELIGVDPESQVDIQLRLESVVEGVLATGEAQVELVGQCSRCLDEIAYEDEFSFQELYYYPQRDAEEDALRIEEDLIDLLPPVRDAIVLELPFNPLCAPDCLGLCPDCGFALNDDPSHHHEDKIDPRWAGLKGLVDGD